MIKTSAKNLLLTVEQTALSFFQEVLRISDFPRRTTFDSLQMASKHAYWESWTVIVNFCVYNFTAGCSLRVSVQKSQTRRVWCLTTSKSYILWCSLAFSVTLFCSEACLVILVLLVRRMKSIGGELGGPFVPKVVTSAFLFSLWLLYLIMSTLEAYGVIQGF